MPQTLNLLDATMLAQRPRFSGRTGALAVLGLVLVGTGLVFGLQTLGRQAQGTAAELRERAAPLQTLAQAAPASAPAVHSTELTRLRQLEAGQNRIRTILDADLAGAREGRADYLVALSRQASSQVWLTGFSVSEDGSSLELAGRMSDPAALADYLRKLDAEPRFKGRPFAQLNLNAMAQGGETTLPFTEFVLRSQPQASKAAP